MDWIKKLNEALQYLEEHLNEEIDYEKLSAIACCSPYHFQRMFTYLAQKTLTQCIRQRRMSLAAVDLQDGKQKVIDVALKYGYSSPTAFNRAFQSVHGIAPSALKKEGEMVKSYPPITFKITIKGVSEMNYRIETKEPLRIIGVSAKLHQDIAQNFTIVPQIWQKVATDGTIEKLAMMNNGALPGLLGVSACNEQEQWRYYIGVTSDSKSDEFEEYIIPSATWAIFPGTGTNLSIQELEQRIISEWLPTSGYEYANAPDIEVYINPDPQNAQYEVMIPVIKKKV